MRLSLSLLPVLSALAHAVTFPSCTASQISVLQTAIERATLASYAAVEHLAANPNGSDLQTEWYGTFNAANHARTLTAFRKFAPDLDTIFSYSCTCVSDAVVATIGSRYGDVRVCTVFFDTSVVPADGFRSQWATIIHEATHFDETLDTVDHGYSPDVCREIAKRSAKEAFENADNHSTFAVAAKMLKDKAGS
ncbi:hypothetical protein ACN47E_000988 [Coniothyrium glycines]